MRGRIMELNLLVAALLTLLGGGNPACTQARPVPSEEQTLEAWLTCEECTNGELAAVVRFGRPLVPRLAVALRMGPGQEAVDAARSRLAATHQSMVEYAKTHPGAPVPMSEREYVDRHLENFIVMYQSRAATGLGALGGDDARRELTNAQALPLRAPVLAVVREALLRLQ